MHFIPVCVKMKRQGWVRAAGTRRPRAPEKCCTRRLYRHHHIVLGLGPSEVAPSIAGPAPIELAPLWNLGAPYETRVFATAEDYLCSWTWFETRVWCVASRWNQRRLECDATLHRAESDPRRAGRPGSVELLFALQFCRDSRDVENSKRK